MKKIRVKVIYYREYSADDLDLPDDFKLENNETAARRASDLAYEEFLYALDKAPDDLEVDFIEVV